MNTVNQIEEIQHAFTIALKVMLYEYFRSFDKSAIMAPICYDFEGHRVEINVKISNRAES